MAEAPLSPASPDDLADALAFALRFDGRKRKHDAGEFMAAIVARRLVEHLDRAARAGSGKLDRGISGFSA